MAKLIATHYSLLTVIALCIVYWLQRLGQQTLDLNVQNLKLKLDGSNTDLYIDRESLTKQVSHSAGEAVQNHSPAQVSSSSTPRKFPVAFPRHIWQTSSEAGQLKYASQIKTWKTVKGFDYHWLSDADADNFVHRTFAQTRPSLVRFWDDLSANSTSHPSKKLPDEPGSSIVVDSMGSSSIVLRADFLRYMLMFASGGVYADIDTSVLQHVDSWIPIQVGSQVINAIIGIEYDDTTYKMFTRPISFCQWTLMSKPGHQIFERAIDRVVSNLEFLARRQKVSSLSQLKLDKLDVLEATGPGMISDVVLQVIQDQLPQQNVSWDTFHDQREGKIFGDVLILPVNAFAGNQKHSHSGNPEYGAKLVQHHFGRSWYKPI